LSDPPEQHPYMSGQGLIMRVAKNGRTVDVCASMVTGGELILRERVPMQPAISREAMFVANVVQYVVFLSLPRQVSAVTLGGDFGWFEAVSVKNRKPQSPRPLAPGRRRRQTPGQIVFPPLRGPMANKQSRFLIDTYFAAFNAGDTKKMESLVADDLIHDVNQGERRVGKDKFWSFNVHMTRCYKERLSDIVLFVSEDGTRAAAEFIVHGSYIGTDSGLPPANGQTYKLPAGSFFEIRNGQIARITTYYNLQDWIDQVTEGAGEKVPEEA
jgi:steroid delta-isomerase-like uncharacterized protein